MKHSNEDIKQAIKTHRDQILKRFQDGGFSGSPSEQKKFFDVGIIWNSGRIEPLYVNEQICLSSCHKLNRKDEICIIGFNDEPIYVFDDLAEFVCGLISHETQKKQMSIQAFNAMVKKIKKINAELDDIEERKSIALNLLKDCRESAEKFDNVCFIGGCAYISKGNGRKEIQDFGGES
jgi:hypothetical protein